MSLVHATYTIEGLTPLLMCSPASMFVPKANGKTRNAPEDPAAIAELNAYRTP